MVVLDDEEIGLIRVKREIKGIARFGVGPGGMSWTALAEGFGADGLVVETEHQLGDALHAAAASDRATLVAVRIDGFAYVDQLNALRELQASAVPRDQPAPWPPPYPLAGGGRQSARYSSLGR